MYFTYVLTGGVLKMLYQMLCNQDIPCYHRAQTLILFAITSHRESTKFSVHLLVVVLVPVCTISAEPMPELQNRLKTCPARKPGVITVL
jgi:hypothetical protein